MNGPRSLIRTMTTLPLRRLVTLSLVPKGSERWAAVMAAGFMRSPEAVLLCNAYHEARPHCAAAGAVVAANAIPIVTAAARADTDFILEKCPV